MIAALSIIGDVDKKPRLGGQVIVEDDDDVTGKKKMFHRLKRPT